MSKKMFLDFYQQDRGPGEDDDDDDPFPEPPPR